MTIVHLSLQIFSEIFPLSNKYSTIHSPKAWENASKTSYKVIVTHFNANWNRNISTIFFEAFCDNIFYRISSGASDIYVTPTDWWTDGQKRQLCHTLHKNTNALQTALVFFPGDMYVDAPAWFISFIQFTLQHLQTSLIAT